MAVVGFTGTIDDKQFSRLAALAGPRVGVESPTAWAPTPTVGVDRSVTFAVGAGHILGLRDDRAGTFAVAQAANATGANRVDLIVMRANWTAKTVTPTAITGSSPTVPPAITKTLLATGDVYDFPICVCITPNGGGAYSAGDIRDIRAYGGSGGLVVPQPDYLAVHDMVPGQRWLVASTGVWYEVSSAGVPVPFGSTVTDTEDAVGTSTSGSYVSTLTGGTACGVVFVAPPSGRVKIDNTVDAQCSVVNFTACTIEIRAGAVIGSGTPFLAAADAQSVVISSTATQTGTRHYLAQGLTPGNQYNVQQWFRVGAGTGTWAKKVLTVTPQP